MKISPDTLMAYADGELDAATRAAVALAVAADPALAAQVAAHQAMRVRVRAAFDAELSEPLSQRLRQAAQFAATAEVVDLAERRAAQAVVPPLAVARERAGSGWLAWGGMAAGLMVGVLLGRLELPGSDLAPTTVSSGTSGVLVSTGLAEALGTQLASAPTEGAVAVRLSFIDRDGRYCRAFELTGQAGLACRSGDGWMVQALVASTQSSLGAEGGLRQAASPLPPALLSEIDQRIAGDPLDAGAEQKARSRGWQR